MESLKSELCLKPRKKLISRNYVLLLYSVGTCCGVAGVWSCGKYIVCFYKTRNLHWVPIHSVEEGENLPRDDSLKGSGGYRCSCGYREYIQFVIVGRYTRDKPLLKGVYDESH